VPNQPARGKIKKKRSGIILFARDACVALAVVGAILISMYAYAGLWPPLVVVESNSMMHGSDNTSHIGAIDTGDLVLVKAIDGPTDIKTYMDGYLSGYKTYGDYGDVIIYKKGGSETVTPIIHRAMIYLEANPDGNSFSAPSLQDIPKGKWKTFDSADTWDHITSTISIFGVGYMGLTVSIEMDDLLRGQAQSGFITKGDHNLQTDVTYWGPEMGYRPIDVSWVVGVARGELPWFGLLKLWSTHTLNSPAPPNSVRDLWIALIIIIISPIAVDVLVSLIERRKISKEKHEQERDEKEAEDASGRAVKPPET
jgi:signal peptidase